MKGLSAIGFVCLEKWHIHTRVLVLSLSDWKDSEGWVQKRTVKPTARCKHKPLHQVEIVGFCNGKLCLDNIHVGFIHMGQLRDLSILFLFIFFFFWGGGVSKCINLF